MIEEILTGRYSEAEKQIRESLEDIVSDKFLEIKKRLAAELYVEDLQEVHKIMIPDTAVTAKIKVKKGKRRKVKTPWGSSLKGEIPQIKHQTKVVK